MSGRQLRRATCDCEACTGARERPVLWVAGVLLLLIIGQLVAFFL